ncbi:hypothetical protein DH2020_027271 [Rehmannia glutinosa]|uniref:DUF1985 domain-containing protein n=1 Tax=Rehmannia glutinosa TaxID=99300 RepID=A0ABR0VUS6_REHGL
MALIPKEKDQFKGKLSCRSWFNSMDLIKVEKFKNSCFGYLLETDTIQFQGQLVLQLLFRQDNSLSIDHIVFHINNKQSVFGPEEFALITGLEFGPIPPIKSKPEVLKFFFGKSGSVFMSDIVSELKEHARKENGKGIMTLKLALLYMLYGVLLVSGPAKKLDEKYIYLVDNLKVFNAYPWGRISYEFIVSDIRSCMSDRVQNFWKRKEKKKAEKKKDHNVEKFDVSGFTHALQVWAYEVMPKLGKLCAKHVSGSTDATPRILRWIARMPPQLSF